ncbi:MAG: Branched-chain amino acid transport system permease protein LivM, partial [uncultured Acetobacteraceae bacterium]
VRHRHHRGLAARPEGRERRRVGFLARAVRRADGHDRLPGRRALRALPRLHHEATLLRALRLGLQPADRLRRAALLRARRLFRHGRLHRRVLGEGARPVARVGDPGRRRRRWPPRRGVRLGGHPPAGHLLRHDHPGAGADGVLLLRPGAVHRRRGRHPGHPTRQLPRRGAARPRHGHVLAGRGHLPRRLPADTPHCPLALRAGAEGHPRERAAHHLSRVQDGPVQAGGLHPLHCPRRRGGRHQVARVRHRHPDGRPLGHERRGGADDSRGRPRHHLRAGDRRGGDRDHAELPGRARRLGHGDPRRDLRRLRARLPPRHHRRAGQPAEGEAV